ncbi:MAG: hypothetical protein IJZ30_06875 [Alphaproteobacteria bacterium]|nr:hypothetical protein [Alphaproteobacteria bacterium]
MKKNYVFAIIGLSLAIIIVLFMLFKDSISFNVKMPSVDFRVSSLFKENPLKNKLFINVNSDEDSIIYERAQTLNKYLQKEGVKTQMNTKGNHKSGNINFYITDSSFNLPNVIDKNAINLVWLNSVASDDNFEKIRDFDVVVVKTISSYNHLKAINVRTAYIPDAIDIRKTSNKDNNKFMYYGDNDELSLVLYLMQNRKIDIYGKGWKHSRHSNNVISEDVDRDVFSKYSFVLVDQTDDEVQQYIVNDKIIRVLNNGAIPFVRYNPGIEKMFGETIPMYYNEEDFYSKLNGLSKNNNLEKIRNDIYDVSQKWNSQMVANKFIEIFDIMIRKKI